MGTKEITNPSLGLTEGQRHRLSQYSLSLRLAFVARPVEIFEPDTGVPPSGVKTTSSVPLFWVKSPKSVI